MSWKSEFGPGYGVPPEFDKMVEQGRLKDLSWHNDSCPSFGLGAQDDLRVFVERSDPALREEPGSKRYTVSTREKVILVTDSGLAAIQAFLRNSEVPEAKDDPLEAERQEEMSKSLENPELLELLGSAANKTWVLDNCKFASKL